MFRHFRSQKFISQFVQNIQKRSLQKYHLLQTSSRLFKPFSGSYSYYLSDDSKEDEAGINNTVTVYIEEDDMEESFKLVTTMRGNSLKGLISIESPMGKAVLGHKVGDRVSVKVNDDYSYDVIIRKIENTGEENEKIRSF